MHFFPDLRGEFGITCGAGVNSLLHALAQIAARNNAYIIGKVYPDFPHWVEQWKGKCESQASEQIREHVSHIRASGSGIVLMDRPVLIGNDISFAELVELCRQVSIAGTIVVVDESNANYCPPAFSAVNILGEVDNLAVLRGLSKAYSMGGLRVGYCISSPQVTGRIRAVVPPMLVSAMSLKISRAILQLGDIAAHLRQRIPSVKNEMESLFEAAHICGKISSSAFLPYIFLDSRCSDMALQLESRGIIGKLQPLWLGLNLYRLSVPLTTERMQLLKQKLLG